MSDTELNPEPQETIIKPKKKVSEKQRTQGLINLEKARDVLKLKRQEKQAIKDEYLRKKAEFDLQKDKKKAVYKEVLLKREQDNQAKVEPIAEPPKKSVKDYVDEIEEHIQKKPRRKRIIYKEETDSEDEEEEVVIKRSSKKSLGDFVFVNETKTKKKQPVQPAPVQPQVIPSIQFY